MVLQMAELLPSFPPSVPTSSLQQTGVLTQTLSRGTIRPAYFRTKNLPRKLEPLLSGTSPESSPEHALGKGTDKSTSKQAKLPRSANEETRMYEKAVRSLHQRVASGEAQAAIVLGKLHFEMV